MSENVEMIIRKSERMRGDRLVNDTLMYDIARHVQPRKANSILTNNVDNDPTEEVERQFDTTAMMANQTLGAGMHSHITPMGGNFASLSAPSEEASYDIKNWFLSATQTLHRELSKSNFHSAVDEFYLDHGGFGTAAMICRITDKGRLNFETLEIGSYSIAEGADRQVDTLYREYSLSPVQILKRFGDDVPMSIKEMAEDEKEADRPLEIIHAIEPRTDYDHSMIDDKNMPYKSCYVLKKTREMIHESGYYEMPFAVSRWRLWGSSPWGWSPSYYALPLSNQLNFLEQCVDVGIERAAFPAWMIPSTIKGEFDPRPHGQNIYDNSQGGDTAMPTELQSTGRIDMAVERENQKRQVIREAFFEDLFRLLSRIDKQMTAREVDEITSEKTTQFHPFFARLTTEFLQPILTRAFAELLRAGKFGNPPEELFEQGADGQWRMEDPDFEFNSRLALALQMGEVNGTLQTIDNLAPIANVLGGEVYDWLDVNKVGAMIARTRGVSSELMRTEEQIAEMQQARQEAQQQEAQAQQAQQLGSAIGSVGGVEQAQQLLG